MPTLPTGFVPIASAYSYSGPGGVSRAEVAGGAARYSLDYDKGVQQFSVTLVLDKSEFSVWTAFYFHLIRKGAVSFSMPLDSGFGNQLHSCNIVPGSYSAIATDGIAYAVSFVVETVCTAYALTAPQVAAYGLSAAALPSGFMPIVAAYNLADPGGVLSDDVPGGVAAYGLDYGRGVQGFSVTLILTPPDYERWAVWFHRLIAKGAQAFTMPLDSGFGTADHTCNIVPGSVQVSRTGGSAMAVSFLVEAENKVYDMTAAEAQSMVDIYNLYGTGTDELLAAIAQFALVDSLVLDW
jgi:hypothetical protein